MPSSSNPLNLVSAALLASMGVPCTLLGVVGVLADSGPMRPVWGMLALGGLGMIGGAVQAVVAWRRAEVRERGHEAALYAAARGDSAGSPAAGAAQTAPADAEVLAHWRYADDEWSTYTRRELRFRKGEALWIGVGVLLLGMLVLAYEEDATYGTAFGVSAFVGAVFYVGKMLQARSAHAANAATRGGEVIISPRAVLLNGRYHVLQDDRFHFGGVRLLDDPPVLEFTVTWSTRSGQANEQVYVPVPRGREAEARALAASFPRPRATAGNRE